MATLGQKLKAAREAKGVSESEAGGATKILTKLIVAMEADDFSVMAAPTYAKGFIRLYATYLDLDPEPLVEEYLQKNVPLRRPLINQESQLEKNSRRTVPFALNLKWLPVNFHPLAWLDAPAQLISKVWKRPEKPVENDAAKPPRKSGFPLRGKLLPSGLGSALPAAGLRDIRIQAGLVAALLVLLVCIISISNCARQRAAEAPPAPKPETARMLLDEPLPDLYLVEPGKIETN